MSGENQKSNSENLQNQLTNQNEEFLKKESRKLSVKEGSAFSIHDGFGLRYISPFALSLGASNTNIGLISSLPGLLGSFSQIISIRAIEKISRKKWVSIAVLIQALLWIPIILIGALYFTHRISSLSAIISFIIVYTIQTISGSLAGPAWNSWMKDLVTKDTGKYFGHRNKICNLITLISMILAGIILDYFKQRSLLIGFGIIFSAAFLGRLLSSYVFTKKYEPKIQYSKGYYFSLFDFIKRSYKSNFGKFTIFVAIINFATAIASPFFAVYMLKDLNLKYIEFTLITISSFIATVIFMPFWGRFTDKYGNIKTLKITSYLVPLIPLFYLTSSFIFSINSPNIVLFLVFAEIYSGFVWAGFNLSAANFLYDAVTRERVAICAAYYNIFNSVGTFIGAILGGLVSSMSFLFFGLSPLLFIFLLSFIIRAVTPQFFKNSINEVKDVEEFKMEITPNLKQMVKSFVELPEDVAIEKERTSD